MSSLEQRANFKFCVLLEKSPSETLEMLKKAYGNDAMKETAVYEWQKRFREGRTNIEDDPRTGSWINLFLKAKLSIKNFTWRSLNDYEMQSDEDDLKNGQQTIGFFYTTMLHHIAL
ncbi:hypothetical protein AVEN_139293-1 [Araneus ventricosus]|uniref:Mos1 transposase HTH domain-containing protein n=1 Tax=Araneus ventricosus TaxID=182803 RepID=A0A4Y2RBI0_ARAVE|nr:hypothetical protein AVEN_72766-1 [Araneus ventricosus]GBN72796.1 hypothetical protein AVEN_139293-1 [Araneus ventricosus]